MNSLNPSNASARAAVFGRAGDMVASIIQAPLLIAMLLIVLLWLGIFQTIKVLEDTKRIDAAQDVSNVARVFEEHVSRTIRETDKTLLFLRVNYEANPLAFNLAKWVQDDEFKTDILVQFALIGPDGIMIESNVGIAKTRIDLSDREHFKVHVGSTKDELFISRPVLGRASGKWSIQLSRRIRNPDGSFAGVLVGSIDPTFLSRFYDGIDLGENAATTLVGLDGAIRARGGSKLNPLGLDLKKSEVFNLIKSARFGVFTEKDPIDNTSRLVAYRSVGQFPLIVMVGQAEADILHLNDVNRKACYFLGICLTLLVVLLMLAMHRKASLDATVSVLAAERDRSEAANKAKSDFLAVMSHEIRTPMNAILGLSSSLLNQPLPDADRKLIKLINEEGDRLLVILNDILDYSKMEAGKMHLEKMTFCPNDITTSVVNIAGPRGVAKGLKIECSFDPLLPVALDGDAGRLRQVLLNLVSNAIKFTTTGKIIIETRCVSRNERSAAIEWVVCDTGIGIAPEHIGGLFSDFVQADSSIRRSFGGSGLGLSISKRIIQQMGGNISIKSAPWQGTEVSFRVDLPIGVAQSVNEIDLNAAATILNTFATKYERSLRVLIVDDSQTNLLVAAELLKEFDFTVDTACDGAEAVTAASKFKYDVILMDMRMPEMDGLQATKAIRSSERGKAATPIIAFTANAFAEDVKACAEAGMTGFVTKPVKRNALLAAISGVLSDNGVIGIQDTAVIPAISSLIRSADPVQEVTDFDPAPLNELVGAIGVKRTREAVQLFTNETEGRLLSLRNSQQRIELKTLEREAHSIKGTSATFGFSELSTLAARLEQNSKTVTEMEFVAVLERMEKSFGRAKLALASCEAMAA